MSAQGWLLPTLGTAGLLAVVSVVLLVRVWPRMPELTSEEMADMVDAPMPRLQRRAWWGLIIGATALGIIAALLNGKGATTYLENDALRLLVLGIFMVGLLGSVVVTGLPLVQIREREALDERDRAVLAKAPATQATLMLLGLAVWMIALAERFHDQGAVPVVYLYLIFGSTVLLMTIGQSLGILLGYWIGVRDAQG